MCIQSGGLVQRVLESAGFTTVTMSNIPDATKFTGVPRGVCVTFPRGALFGEPGNEDKQRRILKASLQWLEEATPEDRYLVLDERWRR